MFQICDGNQWSQCARSSCCTAVLEQSHGVFSFSCFSASKELGVPNSRDGTQPGQLTPTHQGISHTIWNRSAIYAGERRRRRGIAGVIALIFTHNELCFSGSGWTSALYWKVANELQIFLCLHTTFCLPVNCLYFNSQVLARFPLILSPALQGEWTNGHVMLHKFNKYWEFSFRRLAMPIIKCIKKNKNKNVKSLYFFPRSFTSLMLK